MHASAKSLYFTLSGIGKVLKSAMKSPGEEEHQRLGTLLLNTLEREVRLWRAPVLKNGCIQVGSMFLIRRLLNLKAQAGLLTGEHGCPNQT